MNPTRTRLELDGNPKLSVMNRPWFIVIAAACAAIALCGFFITRDWNVVNYVAMSALIAPVLVFLVFNSGAPVNIRVAATFAVIIAYVIQLSVSVLGLYADADRFFASPLDIDIWTHIMAGFAICSVGIVAEIAWFGGSRSPRWGMAVLFTMLVMVGFEWGEFVVQAFYSSLTNVPINSIQDVMLGAVGMGAALLLSRYLYSRAVGRDELLGTER